MSNEQRRIVLIGLSGIVVVYLLYNIFLVDASYYESIPRNLRHISRFVSLAVVYCIGFFSFKNYGVKWIIDIWNVVYIIITPLLLLIGVYDLTLGPAPEQLKSLSKTLHEFLISPIFYLSMLILRKTLGKINRVV